MNLRRTLCTFAIVACTPYLSLKLAWLAGIRIGVDDDAMNDGVMRALNGLTFGMDALVVVVALALIRPWGRRLPAWVPVLPMWFATGLLGTIVIILPLQMIVGLFVQGDPSNDESSMSSWVPTVVYGGFVAQGVALIGLFCLYAWERWGDVLRCRLGELGDTPTAPVQRIAAVAAAATATLPIVFHLIWATGSQRGISDLLADNRSPYSYTSDVVLALLCLMGVAGAWLLAFRRADDRRPLLLPVCLGWLGAGSMVGWGGWMLLTGAMPTDGEGPRLAPAMQLAYSAQVLAGVLVLVVGAAVLAERAAVVRARTPHSTPSGQLSPFPRPKEGGYCTFGGGWAAEAPIGLVAQLPLADRTTASGPGKTSEVCSSPAQRTTNGGVPAAPRTSTISPSRAGTSV